MEEVKEKETIERYFRGSDVGPEPRAITRADLERGFRIQRERYLKSLAEPEIVMTYGEMFMEKEVKMPDGPVTIPIPADPFFLSQSRLAKGMRAVFEVFAPRKTFQLKTVLCPTHKRGSEHEFYGACVSGVQRFDVSRTAQFARGARLLFIFGPYLLPDTQYDLVSLTAEVEEGIAGIRTARNPDTAEGERFDFKAPPLAQFKTGALPQGGGWPVLYGGQFGLAVNPRPPVDTSLAGGAYTVDKRKYRIFFDNETEDSVRIRLEPKP